MASLLDSIIADIMARGGVTKLFEKNYAPRWNCPRSLYIAHLRSVVSFLCGLFTLSEVWNDAFGDLDHLQTYLSIADRGS